MRKMAMSESSGDPSAEITLDDGRTFTGLFQFGDARLSDYRKATGAKFTTAEFKKDETLQQKVADWHFADIEDAINGLAVVLGLMAYAIVTASKAVAHTPGGVSRMKKYVRTKGQYNPSDALGTSLIRLLRQDFSMSAADFSYHKLDMISTTESAPIRGWLHAELLGFAGWRRRGI